MYRYQVQGPNALEVLRAATSGPLPKIPFFNMGHITIAGCTVGALHHGMSGTPGMELYGPWGDRDDVHDALVDAGRDYGLVQVGSVAYRTTRWNRGGSPRRYRPCSPVRR
jgi:glycine cleavage system aminomethyltransferase T